MTSDPFGFLYLAIHGAALVVATGTGLFVWHRKRGAHHWPSVPGKIQFGEVVGSPDGHRTAWIVDLSYSYVVDSQYYAGRHHVKAQSEDQAHEMARNLKDQTINIRYSVENPATSVVLDQDQMSFIGQNLGYN